MRRLVQTSKLDASYLGHSIEEDVVDIERIDSRFEKRRLGKKEKRLVSGKKSVELY